MRGGQCGNSERDIENIGQAGRLTARRPRQRMRAP